MGLKIEIYRKEKKALIVTLTDRCNYGQRLQNYAVQEILHRYIPTVETAINKSHDIGLLYNIKKKSNC